MRVLHAYDHLEEAHSQIQSYQLEIEELEHRLQGSKQRVMVSDIRMVTLEVMIDYLHFHRAYLGVLVLVYFGIW